MARVLAVFAVTGALVIGTGGVTAFASGLAVTMPSAPSVFQLAPCWTSGWSATIAGTPSSGNYTQLQMSGIPAACQGQSVQVFAYSAANALVASATGTPNAGTFTFTTSSYSGAAVSQVWVKVDGWPVKLNWTPPTPTVPAVSCVSVNNGGSAPPGASCTVTNFQLVTWTSNGHAYQQLLFSVNATHSNFRVTFNFADTSVFQGWTPATVWTNGNSLKATQPTAYSCSQLPVLQLNRNVPWNPSTYEVQVSTDPNAFSWSGPPNKICP